MAERWGFAVGHSAMMLGGQRGHGMETGHEDGHDDGWCPVIRGDRGEDLRKSLGHRDSSQGCGAA